MGSTYMRAALSPWVRRRPFRVVDDLYDRPGVTLIHIGNVVNSRYFWALSGCIRPSSRSRSLDMCAATGLALTYLVQREELVHRLTSMATLAGWVSHTASLVVRGVELGRPPLVTLPEVVSVVIWVAVLLELWAEWQYQVKVLGAFVLPSS